MNGRLRRCRCGNPSSRTEQYAPGGSLAAPCIQPFLNRLHHPKTRTHFYRTIPPVGPPPHRAPPSSLLNISPPKRAA